MPEVLGLPLSRQVPVPEVPRGPSRPLERGALEGGFGTIASQPGQDVQCHADLLDGAGDVAIGQHDRAAEPVLRLPRGGQAGVFGHDEHGDDSGMTGVVAAAETAHLLFQGRHVGSL